MKKEIINISRIATVVIGFTVLVHGVAAAQEYKLAKSAAKLQIMEINNLTVEGYTGNEIVFTSLDGRIEKDKRAEGLRPINGLGLEDNTGIGLSVVDKGNVVEVHQLKKADGPRVKIMIPRGVTVSYVHSTPYGEEVVFKNIESEIEVSTTHNGVHMENITGPVTVKTVHGDIEADFNTNIKSPVSIVSAHGLIDVTFPAATKAELTMSSGHGEIFVDPAIKIEMATQSEWVKYGSNSISGKVNGGGLDITLSTSHSNIYLRKK